MVPSLTRKLHASDTSTPAPTPGVRVQWSTNQISESWALDGGTLTLRVTLHARVLLNTCVTSALTAVVRNGTYVKTTGGKTYQGSHGMIDRYYWRCESGVPVMFYSTGNFTPAGQSSVAIANVNDPTDTIGNIQVAGWTSDDYQSFDVSSRVRDGVGNILGENLLSYISWEVTSCYL